MVGISWVSNGTGSEQPSYPWRFVAHLTPHASARIYVERKFHHDVPFWQPPPLPMQFNHGKGPTLGKQKNPIGMDFCAIFDHPQLFSRKIWFNKPSLSWNLNHPWVHFPIFNQIWNPSFSHLFTVRFGNHSSFTPHVVRRDAPPRWTGETSSETSAVCKQMGFPKKTSRV